MIQALGRSVRRIALAVHHRLLPADSSQGWTPYLWLFYLGFFAWWGVGRSSPWALGATIAVFLVVYFNGFWHSGWRVLWNIAAIEALAVIWWPTNPGAMALFIFGAGFCGSIGPPRRGWAVLVGIVALVGASSWVLETAWAWALVTAVLCFMIGSTNIYFAENGRKNADLRRSRDEVERLAALAERERIARDLHDLLGHTLSLITLKVELARKLVERGEEERERAGEELADVERISRDALRQVREAVAGFREVGLAGELARARIACDARGVDLAVDFGNEASEATLSRALGPRREAALALVLREAVTNVVRHSRASCCRVEIEQAGDTARLRVVDDGRGGDPRSSDGSGLAGMRERLAELGGRLEIDGRDGWTLEARLPVESFVESEEGALESERAAGALATEPAS